MVVTMPEEERMYQSYLLRVWQTGSTGHVVWRASLEDALTGERMGFANLDRLFAFLLEQTRGGAGNETAAHDADVRLTYLIGPDE
jgi:hypothetical protein